MDIKKAVYLYFSPTGSTKKVLNIIQEAIGLTGEEIDVTDIPTSQPAYHYDSQTLVVLGIPVYSGRVPKTALDRFEALKGNNTPMVIVATYGNRDFDDALLELKNVVKQKGFCVLGAAAIVTEHSIVHSIGQGRPNVEDVQYIKTFANESIAKLQSIEDISQMEELYVKGDCNYRKYQTIPIVPHSNKNCRGCGVCARKCPSGAIPADAPHRTIKEKCISCMRCIKVCPDNARQLHTIELMGAKQMISMKCNGEKQPEKFL